MININVDNTMIFYLTLAILGLAVSLVIVFGDTDKKKK
jgi:hypothetical protein